MDKKIRSDTVWNKEVFDGFQRLLHKLYGETFNVAVRKSDEDFKFEKFPCAILQIPTYQFSIDRWYKKDRYVVETHGRDVIIDAPPLPFDMQLQMDFYTKLQEDMDTLQIKWLSYFGRDLILDVVTRGGNEDKVLVLADGGAKRMDEVFGKDRLFRTINNFTVHARIDEHDAREVIRIPSKVKVITYLLGRVRANEVSVNKRVGATPDVYTVRQGRQSEHFKTVRG